MKKKLTLLEFTDLVVGEFIVVYNDDWGDPIYEDNPNIPDGQKFVDFLDVYGDYYVVALSVMSNSFSEEDNNIGILIRKE